MIRLYLLIFLIVIGFTLGRKLLASGFSLRQLYSKTSLMLIAGTLLLVLGLTGHLAWVAAMVGVIVTFVVRSLPLLLRYVPQLQRFWQSFTNTKHQQRSAEYETPVRDKMTVAEAYKILGLTPPAARQDIILAHKKLMQKMHPDRGGSDYLASQINLAKDCLLKN
ncbi:MAG: molecular chaperone DnaJ [Methylococcaceae bacterium]|nr:molecular chaperone DnaJ [Methylococcaceae bacterium]